MAQGQMEGIHLFLRICPDILPMNYTTLELARPPHQEVARKEENIGVCYVLHRLVAVIRFESVVSLFLNILGEIERWGELQRCFFRANGQLVVSLKKKISMIER
jgi:hypothetical protein